MLSPTSDPVAGRSTFTKLEEEKVRHYTYGKGLTWYLISEPLFPRVLPYSGAKLRCAKNKTKKDSRRLQNEAMYQKASHTLL
jgi:hypothetical protein